MKGKIPLYTAYTIDELSLPLQKDLALGVPGAQEWVNDLPNAANKKFVADYIKKYPGHRPSFYGAQSYDAANLIASAVAAVKGNLTDKAAVEAALKKADFKSVRGNFKFGNNHFPIQNFYLQDVVKDDKGDCVLKTVATIVKDNQDMLPRQVPDEVIRRACDTGRQEAQDAFLPSLFCDLGSLFSKRLRLASAGREASSRHPESGAKPEISTACAAAESHDALHRAMPERIAVRPAAVPAGGRADAGVRHHGPGQPGARLALHDRRLFRRHLRGLDRQLRARRCCWRSALRFWSAWCSR